MLHYYDIFVDIAFDIDEISGELKQQLDVVAVTYGMSVGEFADQLRQDKEDEQALRAAKQIEEEKAAMSVSVCCNHQAQQIYTIYYTYCKYIHIHKYIQYCRLELFCT